MGVSYDLMEAGADEDGMQQTMRQFLESRNPDMPVLIYDEADYEGIDERLGLPGAIPVTLAIDKTGAIIDLRTVLGTGRASRP